MGGISGRRPRQTFIDGLELVKQKNLDNRLERNLTPVNLSVGQPTSIFSRLFNYVYHLGGKPSQRFCILIYSDRIDSNKNS